MGITTNIGGHTDGVSWSKAVYFEISGPYDVYFVVQSNLRTVPHQLRA